MLDFVDEEVFERFTKRIEGHERTAFGHNLGQELFGRRVKRDLEGKSYLNRANCEFRGYAGDLFREQGVSCPAVYRSDRDDWIMAMVVAGLGFALMPEGCLTYPSVVARPLIEPEFWREVNLVTVRGRPHSPAVGLLAREAKRAHWPGAKTPTPAVERVTVGSSPVGPRAATA